MPVVNQVGNALTGSTGTGSFVGSTNATLTTPNIGAATATSINFGGSTLSSYIAGNTAFTPSFSFVTPGDLSVSYTNRTGRYARVGNVVFIEIYISGTPTYTTSSGQLIITGLPFAPTSQNFSVGATYVGCSAGYPANVTYPVLLLFAGLTDAYLFGGGSANAGDAIAFTTANFQSGNTFSIFSNFFYYV